MFKSSILSCLIVVSLSSGALADEMLIRGAIAAPDGTEIEFSVPISVIQTLKTSGLSAMVKDKAQFNELVDGLIGDLSSLKGENLVEVEMEGCGVQITVDEVEGIDPIETHFVHIDIDPAGENQPKIEFRIPNGIFFLGGFIGNQFMELHGKDFMEMFKKQIMAHHAMPPASPKSVRPCDEPVPSHEKRQKEMKEKDIEREKVKEKECEKEKDAERERIKEEGGENEEIRKEIDKHIHSEEIHQIIKGINPEKLHQLGRLLETILKELN